jgi:hypothetical protein
MVSGWFHGAITPTRPFGHGATDVAHRPQVHICLRPALQESASAGWPGTARSDAGGASFQEVGVDFVSAGSVPELGAQMNQLVGEHVIDGEGATSGDRSVVAIRLHILTRKTLGGLETDLEGRVMRADGSVLPGVYAVGEAVASAAEAHTVTGHSKAPSWVAACSLAAPQAAPWLPALESGSSLSRRKLKPDTCLGKARSARNERSERSNHTGRVRVSGS